MGRYEDLESLQKLKNSGSITDKEYEIEKYKILTNTEEEKKTTTESNIYIVSLILGIIAFLIGGVPIIGIVMGIVGVTVAIKAKNKMKQTGEKQGIVTAGLVLSIFGILIGLAITFGTFIVFMINSSSSII